MWIVDYFKELKTWFVVKRVYRKNKKVFNDFGLKCDWFGRLYKVINRDPDIELGSDEDKVYLQNDLAKMTQFLTKMNIIDILAYDLKPLEDVEETSSDGMEEIYQHAYLIVLTPANNLDRQYVTFWSTLLVFGVILFMLYCIIMLFL